MFLKKTVVRASNFGKVNVEIQTFGENASKRNLVLSENPEKAQLGENQFFLKGVMSAITVPF